MKVVAGVDAGGTHVEIAMGASEQDIVKHRIDVPARAASGLESESAAAIAEALGSSVGPVDTLVAGVAGAGDPIVAQSLGVALSGHGVARHIEIRTDGEIALLDAFPDSPGILLSAGTGSIAYARDSGGAVTRLGGRGWRFGDAGGGYSIARDAIIAALLAVDGVGPATVLTDTIPQAVGAQSMFEAAVALTGAAPGRIALLSREVMEAARAGDAVAMKIAGKAADDLATLVASIADRVPDAGALAFNGGMFDPAYPYRSLVERAVQATNPGLALIERAVDPVMGAWRLARDLAAAR